jgi:psp operon transcriptional activator
VFNTEPDQAVETIVFDPFASPYRPRPPRGPEKRKDAGAEAPTLPSSPPEATPQNLRATVAAYEKNLIERALTEHRHNQRTTADALGLTYNQLRNDLRKHGLLGGGST